MMEFLTYDLKVAVLVAVFYMFYRLLLSRETFHRVNRVVLLATAVASFILPLCVITLHRTVVVSGNSGQVTLDGFGMVEAVEPQTPLWQTLTVVVFFAGLAVTLGHTAWGILKVWRLISRSEHHQQQDGTVVCVTDRDVSPFSWMHYIVLSPSDYEAQDASVLAHERGHIRLHHSLDVILVDTLTALQWFNPAMWMLRQDLRAIHEYEADAAVLSQGINMRQYQYLLIHKALGACGYSVANGITHSTLKNRIHMMLTNKKTNSASWLKLLAMLPIVGAALALNAETVNDYVYAEKPQTPQKKVVKKGRKNGQVKMNAKTIEVKTEKDVVTGENVKVKQNADKKETVVAAVKTPEKVQEEAEPKGVFDVVENMPAFPGGPAELMNFLSTNLKYPATAIKDSIQGRVIATFIVEKDGSISSPKVVKHVSDDLDAEAVRVIESMPKWIPGKQNGKEVRVKYTIPVTFRLK